MKIKKSGYGKENGQVDVKEMLALEEELVHLKQEYGIPEKNTWWRKLGDWLAVKLDRENREISRKRYIKLALMCGWFCGAHRFYAGQRLSGALYLLLCWTGIPFAMTLIDLMIVIPMQPDEAGMIQI